MPKLLSKIVAFLLVPALLVDPVFASGLAFYPRHQIQPSGCFNSQAVPARLFLSPHRVAQEGLPLRHAFTEPLTATPGFDPDKTDQTLFEAIEEAADFQGFKFDSSERKKLLTDLRAYKEGNATALGQRLHFLDDLLVRFGFEKSQDRREFIVGYHQNFGPNFQIQRINTWWASIRGTGRTVPFDLLKSTVKLIASPEQLHAELNQLEQTHGFQELSGEEIALLNSREFNAIPLHGTIKTSFLSAKGNRWISNHERLYEIIDSTVRETGRRQRRMVAQKRIAMIRTAMAAFFEIKKRHSSDQRPERSGLSGNSRIHGQELTAQDIDRLAGIQQDIVRRRTEGASNREIAEALELTVHAVEHHINRALKLLKLNPTSQTPYQHKLKASS